MKSKNIIILAVAIFAAAFLPVNPASAANLTMSWDYTGDVTAVDSFLVYEQIGSNVSVVSRSDKSATASAALEAPLNNVNPGVHTYFVTATNSFWGESGRSNNATTPAGIVTPGNAKVKVTVSGPIGRAGVIGKWIETLALDEDGPGRGKGKR